MAQSKYLTYVDEITNLMKWLIEVDEAEGDHMTLEGALEIAMYMLTQPMSKEMEVF